MSHPHVLVLRAPLSGRLLPLDEVPDPVFAQRVAGEGVAIAPWSSTLVAPCDGRIVHVHPAGHVVVLVTSDGIEVLLHVGLDTARLGGRGFTPLVRAGESAQCGTPLVEFDMGFVTAHAASVITPVLVSPAARIAGLRPHAGSVVAGVDPVLEIDVATPPSQAPPADGILVSDPVRVEVPSGLHARPAAALAEAARSFNARIWLERDGVRADARSIIALVALDTGPGATVRLVACGPEADRAVTALAPLLSWAVGRRHGGREEGSVPAPAREFVTAIAGDVAVAPLPRVFAGVGASPGLAVGRSLRLRRADISDAGRRTDPDVQRRRLVRAVECASAELHALASRTRKTTDPETAAIFDVQQLLLGDPALIDEAMRDIEAGASAERAWARAVECCASPLGALRHAELAAREADLRDGGRRVLRALGADTGTAADIPEATILLVDDVAPSELASLDPGRVIGVASTGGSASSHSAVLARGLDIPLVAAIPTQALDLADGTLVILDGNAGTLSANPEPDEIACATRRQRHLRARREDDLAHAPSPAVTLDGHRVLVTASIGSVAEAERVVAAGGDGIGLLRSEFLFIDRLEPPDEDEQARLYGRIATALGPGRPLVVRTIDAGGDKPLAYLAHPRDEHPGFGDRGIRVSLSRPGLLRTQLRAVLRASSAGRVRVMFPLIAQLDEWRAAAAILEEERARLGVEPLEAGITVEVPSAALMANTFAREADFLSIGTNDLAQFTLAVDRGHAMVASRGDALDPAVLRLVAATADAARLHRRPVAVCGVAAMDPHAIPLLVGLGIDELSVSVPAIPTVKAQVRTLDRDRCRRLAERALTCECASEVRALVAASEPAVARAH